MSVSCRRVVYWHRCCLIISTRSTSKRSSSWGEEQIVNAWVRESSPHLHLFPVGRNNLYGANRGLQPESSCLHMNPSQFFKIKEFRFRFCLNINTVHGCVWAHWPVCTTDINKDERHISTPSHFTKTKPDHPRYSTSAAMLYSWGPIEPMAWFRRTFYVLIHKHTVTLPLCRRVRGARVLLGWDSATKVVAGQTCGWWNVCEKNLLILRTALLSLYELLRPQHWSPSNHHEVACHCSKNRLPAHFTMVLMKGGYIRWKTPSDCRQMWCQKL